MAGHVGPHKPVLRIRMTAGTPGVRLRFENSGSPGESGIVLSTSLKAGRM